MKKKEDFYKRKAKEEGYPSRSVYKLEEIDKKYNLIEKGDNVLDLGCAPGSWLLYISEKIGNNGKVFGIDIDDIKIKKRNNILFIKKDVRKINKSFLANLNKKFQVVVSDLAPLTSGIKILDCQRSFELSRKAFEIAKLVLETGGNFLCKIFESQLVDDFFKEIKGNFKFAKKFRPKATKKRSKEVYIIAKGFNSDEPLDYSIGFVKFLGCKIDLSKRPFIPRPETEYWVSQVIKHIIEEFNSGQTLICLDIFSGSGCIGIAILKHTKNTIVHFSDIKKENLGQIKINLNLNKIKKNRYKLVHSDIFKNIKEKYDYIFANPPYVAKERIREVEKSVLDFEPKISLFAGRDGLFYIRKFLKEVRNHLKRNGKFYLEFDSKQKVEIAKILNGISGFNYQFFKDQYKRWRYLKGGIYN